MASAKLQFLLIIGIICITGAASYTSSNSRSSADAVLIQNIHSRPGTSEGSYYPRRQDYTYVAGVGAYKVHTQAADWNACRRICAEEHGHLAVINSLRESQTVSELARNSGPQTGSEYPEYFHIGIHSLYGEHQWVTIDDLSLVTAGFSEWDVGQPDRDDRACGCINYTTGKFDDSSCATPLAFICELPYAG